MFIIHTSKVHKTASLADKGNSEYCQSARLVHTTLNKHKAMDINIDR